MRRTRLICILLAALLLLAACASSGSSDGAGTRAAGTDAAAHRYVLNTSSRKFHDPDCSSVSTMKDKNKEYFTGTREEVIAMGYSPCGNCKP